VTRWRTRALNEPDIWDEALEILRGPIDRVSIGSGENGQALEIVGEIAEMVGQRMGQKEFSRVDETGNFRCALRSCASFFF